MGYIPSKEQFETVIGNLIKALELAGGDAPVNMMKGRACFENVCGTPHCHAGWYAVAVIPYNIYRDYMDGARQMAWDLGFETDEDLEDWARENPQIWGNQDGGDMFTSIRAFGDLALFVIKDGLKLIVTHWQGVMNRALEVQ